MVDGARRRAFDLPGNFRVTLFWPDDLGLVKAGPELRRRFHLPVHLWDERLTSAQAHRVLRESGISIRKRGQAVDRMAAVLILQSFLDSRQQSAVGGQH